MNFGVLRRSVRRQLPILCFTCSSLRNPRPFSTCFVLNVRYESTNAQRQAVVHRSERKRVPTRDEALATPEDAPLNEVSTRQASRLARRQRRIEGGLLKSNRLIDIVESRVTSHNVVENKASPARDPEPRAIQNAKLKSSEKEPKIKTRKEDGARRLARMAKFGTPNAGDISEKSQSWPSRSRKSENTSATPYIDTEDVPEWKVRKRALKERLNEGEWRPTKRLSPSTVEGIRALHEAYGDRVTLPTLSKHFGVSYEAMRRILKSKSWCPTAEQMDERQNRWEKAWRTHLDKACEPRSEAAKAVERNGRQRREGRESGVAINAG